MRRNRNKYIGACIIGVVASVGVMGISVPSIVLADTKTTVVCDDNTCWNVTVTVPDQVSLYAGEQKQLNVKLSKKDGIQKSFQSSNRSVATVSSGGKITGKGQGVAEITTTISGAHVQKKLTFTTKVIIKSPSIQIVASKKEVKVGKTIKLKVKKCGTTKEVCWSVNKKSIATIGKNSGKLKGKKQGKVKVTATCGDLKKSVTIKVKE